MKIELKERYLIADRLSKGMSAAAIARELNVDRSTIHREIHRCSPYDPIKANELAAEKQFYMIKNPEIRIKVCALYEAGFSKRKISKLTGISWISINKILEGAKNERI